MRSCVFNALYVYSWCNSEYELLCLPATTFYFPIYVHFFSFTSLFFFMCVSNAYIFMEKYGIFHVFKKGSKCQHQILLQIDSIMDFFKKRTQIYKFIYNIYTTYSTSTLFWWLSSNLLIPWKNIIHFHLNSHRKLAVETRMKWKEWKYRRKEKRRRKNHLKSISSCFSRFQTSYLYFCLHLWFS